MVKNIFSSAILHEQISIPKVLIQDLYRTALGLEKLDIAGQKWCKKNYKKGYTSYASLDRLNVQHTVFQKLEKAIRLKLKPFLSATNSQIRANDLVMTTCWVNVMRKGTKHAFHIHPKSLISGTFYLNTPKLSSPLRIQDPRGFETDFYSKSGDLILFESWLLHEVPTFKGNGERVSVSFNYELK